MPRINRKTNDHPVVEQLIKSITGLTEFAPRLLAMMNTPPNLTFLIDGIERTSYIVDQHGERLSQLVDLPKVIGCGIKELGRHFASILSERACIESELGARATAQMDRVDESKPHPLRSYCISTCVYWSGLFYTSHPDSPIGNHDYRDFYAELAVHFLALMAGADFERYAKFIDEWANAGNLENIPRPTDMARIHSRLSGAGRAARRLTLPEHWRLYEALANTEQDQHIEQRVFTAMALGEEHWGEDQWQLLNALALLFVLTVKGWHRPGQTEKSERNSFNRSGGSRSASFRDGFVRISGTDYLRQTEEMENGHTLTLIRRFIDADQIDEEIPVDEQLDDDVIVITEEDEDSNAQGPAARLIHTRQQLRHIHCHLQQLTLARDLPTPTELQGVVNWLWRLTADPQQWPREYPAAPLLVAAALSLGRSVEQIRQDGISLIDQGADNPIEYLPTNGCWRIKVNGPDYSSDEYQAVATEYKLSSRIILQDHGPFGRLLELAGFIVSDRLPIQKLTGKFLGTLAADLVKAAGDNHIKPSMLPKVMLRLLLNASQGDLAVASMLTGQRVGHSATTLYYATYPGDLLRQVYDRAARQLWTQRKLGVVA